MEVQPPNPRGRLNLPRWLESKKMVLRHTHIFGNEKAATSDDVMKNWERNKRREKGFETHAHVLRDIPAGLPALVRAMKVQQKAATPGMDFAGADAVFVKLDEELAELRTACASGNSDNIEDEFGDLLFTMVNLSRFLGVHPELSLTAATEKFLTRFENVEQAAKRRQVKMEDMSPAELDTLWEDAKHEGSSK